MLAGTLRPLLPGLLAGAVVGVLPQAASASTRHCRDSGRYLSQIRIREGSCATATRVARAFLPLAHFRGNSSARGIRDGNYDPSFRVKCPNVAGATCVVGRLLRNGPGYAVGCRLGSARIAFEDRFV